MVILMMRSVSSRPSLQPSAVCGAIDYDVGGMSAGNLAELDQCCPPVGRQGRLRRRARTPFFTTRSLEAAALEAGEHDHGHQGLAVKSLL